MFSVWSITYQQTLFDGSLKECKEFIKVEKQAQKDLNLPKELYKIEKQ